MRQRFVSLLLGFVRKLSAVRGAVRENWACLELRAILILEGRKWLRNTVRVFATFEHPGRSIPVLFGLRALWMSLNATQRCNCG